MTRHSFACLGCLAMLSLPATADDSPSPPLVLESLGRIQAQQPETGAGAMNESAPGASLSSVLASQRGIDTVAGRTAETAANPVSGRLGSAIPPGTPSLTGLLAR